MKFGNAGLAELDERTDNMSDGRGAEDAKTARTWVEGTVSYMEGRVGPAGSNNVLRMQYPYLGFDSAGLQEKKNRRAHVHLLEELMAEKKIRVIHGISGVTWRGPDVCCVVPSNQVTLVAQLIMCSRGYQVRRGARNIFCVHCGPMSRKSSGSLFRATITELKEGPAGNANDAPLPEPNAGILRPGREEPADAYRKIDRPVVLRIRHHVHTTECEALPSDRRQLVVPSQEDRLPSTGSLGRRRNRRALESKILAQVMTEKSTPDSLVDLTSKLAAAPITQKQARGALRSLTKRNQSRYSKDLKKWGVPDPAAVLSIGWQARAMTFLTWKASHEQGFLKMHTVPDSDGKLDGVFYGPPSGMAMLRGHCGDFIVTDSAHRAIGRDDAVHYVGIYCVDPHLKTFPIAHAHIWGEGVKWKWVFEQLRAMYNFVGVPWPDTVLSDGDAAIGSYFKEVFKDAEGKGAESFICLLHAMRKLRKKSHHVFRKHLAGIFREHIVFAHQNRDILEREAKKLGVRTDAVSRTSARLMERILEGVARFLPAYSSIPTMGEFSSNRAESGMRVYRECSKGASMEGVWGKLLRRWERTFNKTVKDLAAVAEACDGNPDDWAPSDVVYGEYCMSQRFLPGANVRHHPVPGTAECLRVELREEVVCGPLGTAKAAADVDSRRLQREQARICAIQEQQDPLKAVRDLEVAARQRGVSRNLPPEPFAPPTLDLGTGGDVGAACCGTGSITVDAYAIHAAGRGPASSSRAKGTAVADGRAAANAAESAAAGGLMGADDDIVEADCPCEGTVVRSVDVLYDGQFPFRRGLRPPQQADLLGDVGHRIPISGVSETEGVPKHVLETAQAYREAFTWTSKVASDPPRRPDTSGREGSPTDSSTESTESKSDAGWGGPSETSETDAGSTSAVESAADAQPVDPGAVAGLVPCGQNWPAHLRRSGWQASDVVRSRYRFGKDATIVNSDGAQVFVKEYVVRAAGLRPGNHMQFFGGQVSFSRGQKTIDLSRSKSWKTELVRFQPDAHFVFRRDGDRFMQCTCGYVRQCRRSMDCLHIYAARDAVAREFGLKDAYARVPVTAHPRWDARCFAAAVAATPGLVGGPIFTPQLITPLLETAACSPSDCPQGSAGIPRAYPTSRGCVNDKANLRATFEIGYNHLDNRVAACLTDTVLNLQRSATEHPEDRRAQMIATVIHGLLGAVAAFRWMPEADADRLGPLLPAVRALDEFCSENSVAVVDYSSLEPVVRSRSDAGGGPSAKVSRKSCQSPAGADDEPLVQDPETPCSEPCPDLALLPRPDVKTVLDRIFTAGLHSFSHTDAVSIIDGLRAAAGQPFGVREWSACSDTTVPMRSSVASDATFFLHPSVLYDYDSSACVQSSPLPSTWFRDVVSRQIAPLRRDWSTVTRIVVPTYDLAGEVCFVRLDKLAERPNAWTLTVAGRKRGPKSVAEVRLKATRFLSALLSAAPRVSVPVPAQEELTSKESYFAALASVVSKGPHHARTLKYRIEMSMRLDVAAV